MPNATVIGAGIGGIATALRLRHKGYKVTVFEANAYPGGKLHAFQSKDFRFDAGPSLFTMPWLVDELFELFGVNPKQYFDYESKNILCNYFWEDGSSFSVKADLELFAKEAAEYFDVEANSIKKYLSNSQKKYDLTAGIFLEKSLHKWTTYFSKDVLKAMVSIFKLGIHTNLDTVNKQHFKDARLVQLFNRYATYNGSSPYKTPGIMSMIPHLEMNQGTFFPKGGMHAITKSLFQLAKDQGVQFKFNEVVTKINHSNGKVLGVSNKSGTHDSNLVVSNMDVFSTYGSLLKGSTQAQRILNQERSSSAIIFYWGINKIFPQLDLHNILFSADYKNEFDCIFEKKTLSDDPTIYINITSKDNWKDAPKGKENWFVMINTPANFGQDWKELKRQARKTILKKIERILKVDVSTLIETEDVLDPVLIETRTSSHQGSLYGASSNSKFAAFLRHSNFSNDIEGLYFCGGSVHPGGGIPLCLLSARIVADLVSRYDGTEVKQK